MAETVEAFARFCAGLLTTPAGEPLELYPEQEAMLADFMDGVRESVILLPKKNGKSGLAAALALHHLLVTPFAEAYIAAASREQAARVLDALTGYVKRAPALATRVRVKQREVVHDGNSGFVRVLAADVDTSDGVTPTLAIVDELHRHKSPELAGLLRDGLGPRDGRMVTISTAGDDEATPLGRIRASAYALPALEQEGAHRYVRHGDTFAFHEWALDPGDDVDDLGLVKTANPAPWLTVESLRERHDSPSMTPWAWRRFACGIWTHGEDSAISDVEWRACADPDAVIPDGSLGVYVGVDLGWKHDCTALVPAWRNPAGLIVVGRPVILTPPGDGTSLDVEDVFDELATMAETWPRLVFAMDPLAGGEQLAQRLDRELERVTVATVSQAHGPMTLAASRLQEAIATGGLRHPDDPELNAHVLAAGVRQIGEAWRFAKQKGREQPIDAVIALAMAVSVLRGDDAKPKKTGKVMFIQ